MLIRITVEKTGAHLSKPFSQEDLRQKRRG